jgi:hypothetical protein
VAKKDFSYICITDDSKNLSSEIETIPLWDKCRYLGGCYNRMFVFSEEMKNLIEGKFLTVDLDTTFIKDFSLLFENDITTVHRTIRRTGSKVYHPGISLIIPGSFSSVWNTFYNENIEKNIEVSRAKFNGTDQAWFNYYLQKYDKYKEIKCWTYAAHGIYLLSEIGGSKKLPKNCILISWAGPRDPYQPEYKKRLPWLEEYSI